MKDNSKHTERDQGKENSEYSKRKELKKSFINTLREEASIMKLEQNTNKKYSENKTEPLEIKTIIAEIKSSLEEQEES